MRLLLPARTAWTGRTAWKAWTAGKAGLSRIPRSTGSTTYETMRDYYPATLQALSSWTAWTTGSAGTSRSAG